MDGSTIPIELEVGEEKGIIRENSLSKRSVKRAASVLYGFTVASDEFQRTSNWKRGEKESKNFNRTTSERGREPNDLEEIYSFKTMLRMLFQSGIIILKEVNDRIELPEIMFPNSWVKFAGRAEEKIREESEEVVQCGVVGCLILFEEFIKSRRMLVTSRLEPTHATSSPPERDLVVPMHPTNITTPRRGQRLRPF
jgi:hypothetical protein